MRPPSGASRNPRGNESGEFGTLHAWLRHHIYRHGRKFKPNELVERATGGRCAWEPYLAYLRTKYGSSTDCPRAKLASFPVETPSPKKSIRAGSPAKQRASARRSGDEAPAAASSVAAIMRRTAAQKSSPA